MSVKDSIAELLADKVAPALGLTRWLSESRRRELAKKVYQESIVLPDRNTDKRDRAAKTLEIARQRKLFEANENEREVERDNKG